MCQASSDKRIEAEKKHMKRKITVLTLCAMLFALCASAATSLAENYVGLDQI
jgi:hypothetical protein